METLSALIAREGKLSVPEAAGWVMRLGQRLQSTHQQGLVHGNVSGYSILTDGRSPLSKGILVDSPRQAEAVYYSPERAASGQLSQADDTWALGVLLFYALTGQYPFQVTSAIDVARAVALGTPKVNRYGYNDSGLQGLFDRVFARDPGKRLAQVSTLLDAIQQWGNDPSLGDIEPLEDDDEDAPTMMMSSVSVGSSQQAPAAPAMPLPQAPLPAPRPAAGAPMPRPAAGTPAPLPPVPTPPTASLPSPPPPAFEAPAVNPRQAPTMLAMRPDEAVSASPFSKSTLTALWIAWAVVTFGGAAVEYAVLSRP